MLICPVSSWICHLTLRRFDPSLGDFDVPLCIFLASRQVFEAFKGKCGSALRPHARLYRYHAVPRDPDQMDNPGHLPPG